MTKPPANSTPACEMDIAGAVYFSQDCHLSPSAVYGGVDAGVGSGRRVSALECGRDGLASQRDASRPCRPTQGDFTGGRVRSGGRRVVAVRVRGPGIDAAHAGGQGIQHHASASPSAAQPMLDFDRGPRGRHADGRHAALWRHDGDRRHGYGHQPGPRPGHSGQHPRYFPQFGPDDFRDLPVWSGLRPCSPDGLPYVGRFARYANLSAATGHAMMGVSLGPITGKLMAHTLSDRAPISTSPRSVPTATRNQPAHVPSRA